MRSLNFFLFAILAGMLVLSACKKDDSPKDLLTGGIWTATDFKVDLDGDGTLDSDFEDCEKDNTITFKSDGTVLSMVGAVLCDSSDVDSNGTYVLNEEGTLLTLTEDGVTLPFTVVELTSSRFVFQIDFLGISQYIYTR